MNWLHLYVFEGNDYPQIGGNIATGKTLRIYSWVSDADTAQADLAVSISYRPSGGSWVPVSPSYESTQGYWYYDWAIPSGTAMGLYDIQVDVVDPDGGTVSSTTMDAFNLT